jgi:hypothetical protein
MTAAYWLKDRRVERTGVTCHEHASDAGTRRDRRFLVRGVCVARHLFVSSAVAARFGARVTVMAAAWLWWHVEEIQS